MPWEILFVGVFFTMIGLILFFSKTPHPDQRQTARQENPKLDPPPVLRPVERLFDFEKLVLFPIKPPSNSQILVIDGEGGLLFYVERESSLTRGFQFKVYMNQTKQDLLLIINKDSSLQMVPLYSFYDSQQDCIGQIEKDVLSGKRSRWYLVDADGKRFAHVEKDKEAVAWSNLSEEPRHAEKYNIIPGALIAGRFNKDDYDPDKYILDLSQDNGRLDRRLALCMALVLVNK